jgi:hypothetical protein
MFSLDSLLINFKSSNALSMKVNFSLSVFDVKISGDLPLFNILLLDPFQKSLALLHK